ncbi:hypothetical protein [Spirillospora albida]|uniref:hypothetical protein n=1 Tax=Spirillospora albida TaxID=58123 RepID=UPI0006905CD0|nr:hypothetical protein [Spirillospora albida]
MTNTAWLNLNDEPVAGQEILRSDRTFQLWAYSPSHSRLLLRSRAHPPRHPDGRGRAHQTTFEVLFAPVSQVRISASFDGLILRYATVEEAATILSETPDSGSYGDQQVLVLESQGATGHIITGAVGWHDDILSPTRLSFFASIDPDQPGWPRHALGPGYDAGLDMASAQELIEALTTAETGAPIRSKYRTVHVVMTRIAYERRDREPIVGVRPAGAFLTQIDAEDFEARLQPLVAESWIEEVAIAV